MKRFAIALLAVTSVAAFAPSNHAEDRRDRERRQERKEEAGWVKLGEKKVDYKSDKDTIEVGKSEGRFSRLRFRVLNGDIELSKMKIFFEHGDPIEPKMQHHFKEGDRSHDIDLPGEARQVKKVEFYYRSEHKHDEAVVELVGKEAR